MSKEKINMRTSLKKCVFIISSNFAFVPITLLSFWNSNYIYVNTFGHVITWYHSCSISLTLIILSQIQFTSVTQSHQTLCDPMDYSMPGLRVHH